MHVILIVTSDGLDQIVESLRVAALEMHDLKEMGCDNLRAFVIDSVDDPQVAWQVADVMEAKFEEGKPVGRKTMRTLAEEYGVLIKLVGARAMMEMAMETKEL